MRNWRCEAQQPAGRCRELDDVRPGLRPRRCAPIRCRSMASGPAPAAGTSAPMPAGAFNSPPGPNRRTRRAEGGGGSAPLRALTSGIGPTGWLSPGRGSRCAKITKTTRAHFASRFMVPEHHVSWFSLSSATDTIETVFHQGRSANESRVALDRRTTPLIEERHRAPQGCDIKTAGGNHRCRLR